MIKIANTKYPVNELIKHRWSARAFSNKEIDDNTLFTLFEAAGWAPSANNEQPWRYIYAKRSDKEAFEKIVDCLMPGNKPWAKNAAVLAICFVKTTTGPDNKPNAAAFHDAGLANATLMLQATAMNIYGHMMGGYDKAKTKEAFGIPGGYETVLVLALGYLDDPETLEEPFKTREVTPRTRKGLNEFLFHKEGKF
ncbi:MAG: nitroreductase family protein [Bacteroidia bacterium]